MPFAPACPLSASSRSRMGHRTRGSSANGFSPDMRTGPTATVYCNGIGGCVPIFMGTYAALPSSVSPARTWTSNPALFFVQGCQSISSSTRRRLSCGGRRGDVWPAIRRTSFVELRALDAAQHAPVPESLGPDFTAASGYVGPYGSASANSLHPGGVNLCFADGSVHFIKNSVSLQAWWGLGTRAGAR